MANLHIPGGFAQLAFRVSNATVGHQCFFTLGVDIDPGWTQLEQDQLFTDVATALKPLWDSNVVMTGFHGLIGSDGGPPLVAEVTGSVAGTAGPKSMAPPNVTFLVKKVTPFAGRRFRGRLYLPFVSSTALDENGRLLTGDFTALQTAATALYAVAGKVGNGINNWMLLHTATGVATTETPTLITRFSAENVVATQRRRLER